MERCRWEGQNFQPVKEVQRLEEEEEEEEEGEGGRGEEEWEGGGGGEEGGGGGGGEEEESAIFGLFNNFFLKKLYAYFLCAEPKIPAIVIFIKVVDRGLLMRQKHVL